jgi:hypothetical protein
MRCALLVADAGVAARPRFPEVPGAVEVGHTGRVRVHADALLGARGRRVAEVLLDTLEEELDAVAEHFGNIALPDQPVDVVVARLPGVERAYHHAPGSPELFVDARTLPVVEPRYTRFLVRALLVHLFATARGRGWSPENSMGEALSRALAASRYPRQIAGFATAPAWLDSDRADVVQAPPGRPDDPVAVGGAVLFLNSLHYQLGYSWEDIIASGGPPLAETYGRLAGGHGDAYDAFRREVDALYPPGRASGLGTDNPFPRAGKRARQVPAEADAGPEDDAATEESSTEDLWEQTPPDADDRAGPAAADDDIYGRTEGADLPVPVEETWSGDQPYEPVQTPTAPEPGTGVARSRRTPAPVEDGDREDDSGRTSGIAVDDSPLTEWLEEADEGQPPQEAPRQPTDYGVPEPPPVTAPAPAPSGAGGRSGAGRPVATSTLRRAVTAASYPASRKRLVEAASDTGASARVLELLRRLPARRYPNPDAVLTALGELQ